MLGLCHIIQTNQSYWLIWTPGKCRERGREGIAQSISALPYSELVGHPGSHAACHLWTFPQVHYLPLAHVVFAQWKFVQVALRLKECGELQSHRLDFTCGIRKGQSHSKFWGKKIIFSSKWHIECIPTHLKHRASRWKPGMKTITIAQNTCTEHKLNKVEKQAINRAHLESTWYWKGLCTNELQLLQQYGWCQDLCHP